jgi:hypothetical protein
MRGRQSAPLFFGVLNMNESEHKLKAERIVKKASKIEGMRSRATKLLLGVMIARSGRYTLNMLINNLDAMIAMVSTYH